MPKDTHGLVGEPGAQVDGGTAGKEKKVPRKTFRESIGQGSASGGSGQLDGAGGTGDPAITYRTKAEWSQDLGKAGKFGTPEHTGKRPINYDIDLASLADEY